MDKTPADTHPYRYLSAYTEMQLRLWTIVKPYTVARSQKRSDGTKERNAENENEDAARKVNSSVANCVESFILTECVTP